MQNSVKSRLIHFPSPHQLREAELKKLTAAIVAALWVPCAILSLIQSRDSLGWFLSDYAAQSRMLVVVPLLILGRPGLAKRLQQIADHFAKAKLIDNVGRAKLESWEKGLRDQGESFRVRAFFVFISYVFAFSFLDFVQRSNVFMPWCYRGGGSGKISAAGGWYLFATMPVVLFLLLRWIWRQFVWLIFLKKVSNLDLRLIPSHPDRAGGLTFVETCHRKYVPFCLAMGTLLAGGVANRIAYLHAQLVTFKYVALVVVALVLVICVTPLCVFFYSLLRAKRQGMFTYGTLATSMGRRFEERWMPQSTHLNEGALVAPDFSATTDLNSITANVYEMRSVPFKSGMLVRLAAWTLVPMVPVAVATIPLDVLTERVLKLLL